MNNYEVKLINKYSSVSLLIEANNPTTALNYFFDYFKDKISEFKKYEIEITPYQNPYQNFCQDFWELRKN